VDVVALARLVPRDGRKLEETMLVPSRQQTEDVAQVRPWLDIAESAAREQRGE